MSSNGRPKWTPLVMLSVVVFVFMVIGSCKAEVKSLHATAAVSSNPTFATIEPRASQGRSLLLKGILLVPLALLFILILFLPIPVIAIPGGRRSDSNLPVSESVARVARRVAQSEECIEKISCQISRVSRSLGATKYIKSAYKLSKYFAQNDNERWSKQIARGLEESFCTRFSCTPFDNMFK